MSHTTVPAFHQRIVSVIIVNWNADNMLERCLASVERSRIGAWTLDVLVVDNASTDGSLARGVEGRPGVRVVQNRRNVGFAHAVNIGLRDARGEVALVLNPDVLLTPDMIAGLTRVLETNPKAAVVAPCVRDPDGTVQGSARRDPSVWTGLFGRRAPLTVLFPGNAMSRRELPAIGTETWTPVAVDWLAGCCLMVRRAAWSDVGLMDERFFLYWEDADWCRRFRRQAWTILYCPQVEATHFVGFSTGLRPIRTAANFCVSAYRYHRKYARRHRGHPMEAVVVAGLAVDFLNRVVQQLRRRVVRQRWLSNGQGDTTWLATGGSAGWNDEP